MNLAPERRRSPPAGVSHLVADLASVRDGWEADPLRGATAGCRRDTIAGMFERRLELRDMIGHPTPPAITASPPRPSRTAYRVYLPSPVRSLPSLQADVWVSAAYCRRHG